jgi:hypothetical protein
MKKPITLYLIGFAGTGKYTIAKELGKCGYKIVDNHLLNNPIFSLLDLNGVSPIPDNAWEAIRKIREAVLNFVVQDIASHYVFTNELLEEEYDYAIYNQVKNAAEQRGSLFIPVKITVSLEEHNKRIGNLERKERFKETTIAHNRVKKGMIKVSHSNLLELDGSDLSASQAAAAILLYVSEISK